MQLAGVFGVQSWDGRDSAEIAAGVLLGLACLFLMGSGFIARKKTERAKGGLRLVAGSGLLLLVGFAIYGSATSSSKEREQPTVKPRPSPTVTVDAAKTFETCDEAKVEFQRLYRQLLERGSDGDVAGMTATAETQRQTTVLNDCFSKRSGAAVVEVLATLKADPLTGALTEGVSKKCRPVMKDALRLLKTAILRKAAGDRDGATRLGDGIETLGQTNKTCLPQDVIDAFEAQLDGAPLTSANGP